MIKYYQNNLENYQFDNNFASSINPNGKDNARD